MQADRSPASVHSPEWLHEFTRSLQAGVQSADVCLATELARCARLIDDIPLSRVPAEETVVRALLASRVLRGSMRHGSGVCLRDTVDAVIHLLAPKGIAPCTIATDFAQARRAVLSRRITAAAPGGVRRAAGVGSVSHPAVKKSLAIVRSEHARLDLSLSDLASRTGLTPGRLSRLFRAETGLLFSDFLLTVRMERSWELLSDPNLSSKEVAHKVGYAHQSNFTRAFRGWFGMSPRDARARLQSAP